MTAIKEGYHQGITFFYASIVQICFQVSCIKPERLKLYPAEAWTSAGTQAKTDFRDLTKTPFNTLDACLSLYGNNTICVFRLKTKVYTSVNLPHQGLWRKINGFNSRGQRS